MKLVDEFRDPDTARRLSDAIASIVTRPWTLMEVCGGQTHSIVRFGIDRLLPEQVSLIHGPGCPVCVTSTSVIDHAIAIAQQPQVIMTSFGDMLRVPGAAGSSLLTAKSHGADVRMVYSPLDAVAIARAHPERQVVFLAVGFETTAPTTAMAAWTAKREGLKNFSMLVAHVLVPPAIESIMMQPDVRIDGFLAAGHVCTIMGYEQYEPLTRKYGVPIVVTGFEPVDILQGVLACVKRLENGQAQVENQYARSVRRGGNETAQALMREVFAVIPREWRGIGVIPESGLGLSDSYREFDAVRRFPMIDTISSAPNECISGMVLRGAKRPIDCPAFGTHCTPEHPLGAPMVSSEGACAAYYRFGRKQSEHRLSPVS